MQTPKQRDNIEEREALTYSNDVSDVVGMTNKVGNPLLSEARGAEGSAVRNKYDKSIVSLSNLAQLPQLGLAEKMDMALKSNEKAAGYDPDSHRRADLDPLGLGSKYGEGLMPDGYKQVGQGLQP